MTAKPPNKKKHLWRACPYGEHWRKGSKVSEYYRRKRKVRAHFRKGSCVFNPTGRDQMYLEEIVAIAEREFSKLKGPPAPLDLGYKYGSEYDELIRGWVRYWNQVLQPKPALEANLVKALIATESGFREDVETKVKDKGKRAYGLMQVLGNSFKIMQDEKGEIRDHYLNVPSRSYKVPSANVAAGVRWLIHKFELYRKNHPKGDWIDAIAKYKKLPRTHKVIKELEAHFLLLSKKGTKS
jgi:hypothetical protein